MKTYITPRIKLKIVFLTIIFFNLLPPSFGGAVGGLFAQEPELFRTWYLTKVTVNNIDYIPSDYGYYPDLVLDDENGDYSLSLADPLNISCITSIENFQTNPDSFIVNQQNWLCFPKHTCFDEPCSIIYGRHADIYYGITTSLTYIIGQNSDETFTLEIANTEGNYAYYSSELLSTNSFTQNSFTLYPNPANEVVYVQHQNSAQHLKATIFDLNGKPLYTQNIAATQSEIDIASLNSGVYFIVLENDKGIKVTKKLVKQ